MSLNVSLEVDKIHDCNCKYCGYNEDKELYSANITHNLNKMADAVKILNSTLYYYLWRPEEIEVTHAYQLIEPLTIGLKELKDKPNVYKLYDSLNGWGKYIHFVPFVENYLKACIEYRDAKIYISR